jgi:phosphomannomutase
VDLIKQRHWAGEGNGGIIYQVALWSRLSGCCLILNTFSEQENESFGFACFLSGVLHEQNKIELTPKIDVDAILVAMTENIRTKIVLPLTGEN